MCRGPIQAGPGQSWGGGQGEVSGVECSVARSPDSPRCQAPLLAPRWRPVEALPVCFLVELWQSLVGTQGGEGAGRSPGHRELRPPHHCQLLGCTWRRPRLTEGDVMPRTGDSRTGGEGSRGNRRLWVLGTQHGGVAGALGLKLRPLQDVVLYGGNSSRFPSHFCDPFGPARWPPAV